MLQDAMLPCRTVAGSSRESASSTRTCMRMSARSAGEPTAAPRPPATRPAAAFCHSGGGCGEGREAWVKLSPVGGWLCVLKAHPTSMPAPPQAHAPPLNHPAAVVRPGRFIQIVVNSQPRSAVSGLRARQGKRKTPLEPLTSACGGWHGRQRCPAPAPRRPLPGAAGPPTGLCRVRPRPRSAPAVAQWPAGCPGPQAGCVPGAGKREGGRREGGGGEAGSTAGAAHPSHGSLQPTPPLAEALGWSATAVVWEKGTQPALDQPSSPHPKHHRIPQP